MTSSTRRAVLCADGRIHYADELLRGQPVADVVAIANAHAGQPYCGGAPHYLAEQTVTVSPWVRVEEHNKGEQG